MSRGSPVWRYTVQGPGAAELQVFFTPPSDFARVLLLILWGQCGAHLRSLPRWLPLPRTFPSDAEPCRPRGPSTLPARVQKPASPPSRRCLLQKMVSLPLQSALLHWGNWGARAPGSSSPAGVLKKSSGFFFRTNK